MNIIHLDAYTAQFAPVRNQRAALRPLVSAPARGLGQVFTVQIEDALTQLIFVAAALGFAALLRIAPVFTGRDAICNAIDFAAACGLLHGLIGIAKTLILTVSRRA